MRGLYKSGHGRTGFAQRPDMMTCHYSRFCFGLAFKYSTLTIRAQNASCVTCEQQLWRESRCDPDCRDEIRNDDLFGSNVPPWNLGPGPQISYLYDRPSKRRPCRRATKSSFGLTPHVKILDWATRSASARCVAESRRRVRPALAQMAWSWWYRRW